MKVIQIYILLINCFLSFSGLHLSETSSIALWSYLIVIGLEIYQKKRITILIIFLIAFVYMVLSEGVLNEINLYRQWGLEYVKTGYSYLILSSTCVFLGYKVGELKKPNKRNIKLKSYKTLIYKRKTLIIFLSIFSLVFFAINLENTIYGFTMGRASAFPYFFSPFLYAMAFICIGLITEVFKKKWIILLFSLPIIITFIGTGTRYFLVFILFIIFFKDIYNLTLKKGIKFFFIGILLLSALNIMKMSRSVGISTINKIENNNNYNLTEYVASKGSNEGLISNAAMITKYTEEKNYTYGKSIGFLAIFWIPRELWKDKPVQLDSWLIKEYMNVSEGFSSASSYGGELYMDFGYIIACFLLLIFGLLLFYIQSWIHNNYKTDLKKLILSGFLYGWMFFGTRSILTSTYMLVYVLIMSTLIFKFLKKFNILILIPSNEK